MLFPNITKLIILAYFCGIIPAVFLFIRLVMIGLYLLKYLFTFLCQMFSHAKLFFSEGVKYYAFAMDKKSMDMKVSKCIMQINAP